MPLSVPVQITPVLVPGATKVPEPGTTTIPAALGNLSQPGTRITLPVPTVFLSRAGADISPSQNIAFQAVIYAEPGVTLVSAAFERSPGTPTNAYVPVSGVAKAQTIAAPSTTGVVTYRLKLTFGADQIAYSNRVVINVQNS